MFMKSEPVVSDLLFIGVRRERTSNVISVLIRILEFVIVFLV